MDDNRFCLGRPILDGLLNDTLATGNLTLPAWAVGNETLTVFMTLYVRTLSYVILNHDEACNLQSEYNVDSIKEPFDSVDLANEGESCFFLCSFCLPSIACSCYQEFLRN